MKKTAAIAFLTGIIAMAASFSYDPAFPANLAYNDSLRALYARPVDQWPRPFIDTGVNWKELSALLPDSVSTPNPEDPRVQLGKTLFFDPRLSGSNQISCASCHNPDLAWTDTLPVSVGHNKLKGTRNTPTLLNVALVKDLFWDGRATTLQDQAISPIATPHEMNQEPPTIPAELNTIPGYPPLFEKAFGDRLITLQRVLDALAIFEQTIVSRQSRFDQFITGRYDQLSDQEVKGLHLFRTKARCMNCHNGTYFTDYAFHNTGLKGSVSANMDKGRYGFTRDAFDMSKFRTPSLRDVMLTQPWMHDGSLANIDSLLNRYDHGMFQPKPTRRQKNDPLFPRTDPLVRKLYLTPEEKKALVAFLDAITGIPYKMDRPRLPQ